MVTELLKNAGIRLPIRRSHPLSPWELYGELFEQAQRHHATLDNKSFADAVPRMSTRAILRAYARESRTKQFSYSQFVETYFTLPEDMTPRTPRERAGERDDIRDYIERTWTTLTRTKDTYTPGSSLLPLPRPYIVPGGRFRETYYWDSYFTMVGLAHSGRHGLVEHMVENFAHLIRRYGHIPNGNRTYYLTRSNQPFFALMVELLARELGPDILVRYLGEMEREYAYWMRGEDKLAPKTSGASAYRHVVRLPSGEILNRYYDVSDRPREEMLADDLRTAPSSPPRSVLYRDLRAAAESGWDFSSRWCDQPLERATSRTTRLAPVDLNCLLALYEMVLARAHDRADHAARSATFRARAERRTEALRTHFFDEVRGFYVDLSWETGVRSPALTLAGTYALFANIATSEQADRMETVLRERFLRPGGLVTTLVTSGEQWDAPNGWAPLQYVAVEGLERYGRTDLARDIAERWVEAVKRMYKRFGAMLEKYNVDDPHELAGGGEYGIQDGFGWTNAVTLDFLDRYEISSEVVFED